MLTLEDDAGKLEIANILFMDLIGYSLLPMDQQRGHLDELQRIVRDTGAFQQAEGARKLISLPTGDGMALAFFGDPTLPAQCAFEISKVLRDRSHLKLRMGIHSGPVYRVDDINANANVAGGGINMAQRVMDSGDAGHILVSKAVADVLAQLSSWKPHLVDLGEHPVKHGVIIHTFNLVTTDVGNSALPQKFAEHAGSKAKAAAGSSKMPLIALAVVLVAGAGFGTWKFLSKGEPKELSYSFTVQRSRDGQVFGEDFQTSGNVIFEKGYRVAMNFTAPKAGYLYVVNEGPDEKTNKRTFVVLNPMAGEKWDARLGAGQKVRTPQKGWFRMDQTTGTEISYVVWSPKPVAELERLKTLSTVAGGLILIENDAGIGELREFLTKNLSAMEEKSNAQNNETELRTQAEILIQKIPLRHQ